MLSYAISFLPQLVSHLSQDTFDILLLIWPVFCFLDHIPRGRLFLIIRYVLTYFSLQGLYTPPHPPTPTPTPLKIQKWEYKHNCQSYSPLPLHCYQVTYITPFSVSNPFKVSIQQHFVHDKCWLFFISLSAILVKLHSNVLLLSCFGQLLWFIYVIPKGSFLADYPVCI